MSSTVPSRPMGWRAMKSLRACTGSGSALIRSCSEGVSTVPGQTALQRIPCRTKSAAIDLVRPITAALLEPEAKRLGRPRTEEATEDMLMVEPPRLRSIPGRKALVARNIDVTLTLKARFQIGRASCRERV